MRLLRDLLLIKSDDPLTQSAGGVDLPDTAEEPVSSGVVEQTGPLVDDVRVGDRVKLASFAGTQHQIEGVAYLIAKETDVLLILSRPEG